MCVCECECECECVCVCVCECECECVCVCVYAICQEGYKTHRKTAQLHSPGRASVKYGGNDREKVHHNEQILRQKEEKVYCLGKILQVILSEVGASE